MPTAAEREIEAFFDEFNRAWLEGRPRDVAPLLHPDVVIAPPGGAPHVHGAAAFVESLVAFLRAAQVHRFDVLGVKVRDWGAALAAAWLEYDIEYTESGRRTRERAEEVWLLERHGSGWRALLRDVHPSSPAAGR